MKKIILLLLIITSSQYSFTQEKDIIPYEKNDVRLDFKLPHINFMSIKPNGEFRATKIGFNGYGVGLEYNYNDRKFLETSASIVLTFELPFPAHIDKEYNKYVGSYYYSLTDNFIKGRVTFGYGLNYSSNIFNEYYRDLGSWGLPITEQRYYLNNTLGLTLNAYYRAGKSRHYGIIYRPTFFMINDKIKYNPEHLVSFEFNWRFKLINLKKEFP